MAHADEYISGHFNHFDASLKEHTGLSKIIGHLKGTEGLLIYVCPMCLERRMGAHQFELRSFGDFTKDHFPPKNVGGNKTILICDKCNNSAGSNFEFILKELLEFRAFQKRIPNARLPMKHTIISNVKGHYQGELIIDKDGNTIIDPKPNKKKNIPPLDKWIEYSKTHTDYTLTFTLYEPNQELLAKAFFKSAYLYCFLSMGYEFAMSKQAEMMRKVMNGEINSPIPAGHIGILDEHPEIHEGLVLIKAKEFQTLAVILHLKIEMPFYECWTIVPVPAPTQDGWEKLSVIAETITKAEPLEMNVTRLPDYLSMGELYGYSKCWTTDRIT